MFANRIITTCIAIVATAAIGVQSAEADPNQTAGNHDIIHLFENGLYPENPRGSPNQMGR